jgi:hypothetical protein
MGQLGTTSVACVHKVKRVLYLLKMPRSPKYPDNPVTRLRAALSTETFKLTRVLFAKRCGLSLDSLTAVERGKYRLSREMAQRLEFATGVSAASLILNSKPLMAWNGTVFNAETTPPSGALTDKDIRRARYLLDSALQAAGATKCNRARQFVIMFEEWLARAVVDLDCGEPFWERIFKGRWISPDESLIHRFNPNVVAIQRTGKQLEPAKMEPYLKYIRLVQAKRGKGAPWAFKQKKRRSPALRSAEA